MATLSYQAGLLRGLLSRERGYVGPFYVHIDVTHRCNLKCLCCRWHSPLIDSRRDKQSCEDMPYERFVGLCDDLRDMGTQSLYFVGTGEPMLHPRIFDLIAAAKDRGFELVMYTNGLLLDEANIEKLLDLQLDVLRVSLWSATADKFVEQVDRSTPEMFQRIVDGVCRLARRKAERGAQRPLIELCQSITHHDVQDLEDIVPLARRTGCGRLCFSPLVDFDEAELRRYLPDAEGIRRIVATLKRLKGQLASLGIDHNIDTMLLHYRSSGRLWRRVPCYPSWYFSYFRTDGKVFICQRNTKATVPVGDLAQHRFADIWNNDSYRTFRRSAFAGKDGAGIGGYFCNFCSHSMNSQRIHRRFRWLKPVRFLMTKSPT